MSVSIHPRPNRKSRAGEPHVLKSGDLLKALIISLLVIGMGGVLAGCGTGPIDVGFSHSRLDSPESYGAPFAGRLHTGHRSTHKASVTPNYGTILVTQASPGLSSVADSGSGLGLGVWDRIDLDFKSSTGSPDFWQLKVQLLGENRRNAQPGDFSLAVSAGYGTESDRGSGTDNSLLTPRTAVYEDDSELHDIAVILGYRISPVTLAYGGMSKTWLEYAGLQTPFTGGSFPFSGRGQQTLVHLGFQFSSPRPKLEKDREPRFFENSGFFAQLEGSGSWLRVGSASRFQPNGSVNAGIAW